MQKNKPIAVFRGGGDIATGSIQKLYSAGFNILVLENTNPSCIRRTVALAETVYEQTYTVENMKAVLTESIEEIYTSWDKNMIAVKVDPECKIINEIHPLVLIDAILAKKNLGTYVGMAPITVALGPGFTAGKDADIVIETQRGHNLGRLIFKGEAEKNTGIPGNIGGYSKERVLHSPSAGKIYNYHKIGDIVKQGETISEVGGEKLKAKISGVLRGMIRDGFDVYKNMKVGDIDPRMDTSYIETISDKARAVGGGTLEAVMLLMNERNFCI